MKFSAAKETIFPILQFAGGFTTHKNLSTILQNIYIEAEGSQVTIKSTNFQTGFSASIAANVVNPGSTTVSAKKIADIVKELPEGDIDFVYDGSRLHVKAGKSSFQLATMDSEHFPQQPAIVAEYSFNIDGKMLLDLFKKTAFCISNDTSKIEYNGAHISVFANTIEISAADYQRIATASAQFSETMSDEFIINVPKKTVQDVLKIFDNSTVIHVETDKRQVLFRNETISVTSKLIEKYIKGLTKLFNTEYSIRAKIDKNILFEVVKRISSITSEVTHGVLLSFNNNILTVSSLETEYGKGTEIIDNVEFNGETMDIIFNSKHLLEILSYIDGDTIEFAMSSSISPALILPENTNVKYLLVPISIEKIS